MANQRRRLPPASRLVTGIAVVAAAMLAGCVNGSGEPEVVSAGGSSTPGPTADRDQLIKQYRDCLEQHGLPVLEHPTDEGLPQIDKGRTSTELVSVALEECRAYLPTGGDAVRPPQADIEAWQRYAVCIREHGVPSYPDPDPQTGDQQLSEELSRQLKNDPALPAAQQTCRSILPSRSDGTGTVGG